MLVLRLQLKKQLFHGDGGKDLKLFPVGLSRVLCPKIQGLFDPQRTPGSQLSHLCLTSAGSEDMGLKVKFRLCPFRTQAFTAPKGRADPPHTQGGQGRSWGVPHQPHLPFPGWATKHNKPKLAEQTQTGSAEMLWANPHLESHPAASWSLQNFCFSKRKGSSRSQLTHKPHSSASLMLH